MPSENPFAKLYSSKKNQTNHNMFPKILLLSSSLLFISHGVKMTLTPPQYKAVFKAKNDEKLRLMFAGDIMSQGLQIEAARKSDGSFDYTPCFQDRKSVV